MGPSCVTTRRRALAGLGLVLALFAALALGGALVSTRGAAEVARSGDLATAYLRMHDAFTTLDSVEDAYEDGASPALRPRFELAARELDDALRELERAGGPRDRALASRVAPLHRRYVTGMRVVFDAVEAGDARRAAAVETAEAGPDAAQDALQPLLSGVGPEYAIAALHTTDDLARTGSRVLHVTLVAVPVGALLYALVVLAFARLQRRLDRSTQRELDQLRRSVRTDALTGMGSYRAFHADVRELAAPGALVVVDVVGVGRLNASRGHVAGDAHLKAVGAALAEQGACYRLGADKFALIVPGEGALEAIARAERAGATVGEAIGAGRPALRAGAAELGPDVDPDELLRRADLALLAAKREARSAVAYARDLELPDEDAPTGADGVRALTTALAQAVDAKDAYTRSHCETVSTVAALIAEELGLDEEHVARVRLAGLLHDVGKIGIPDAILHKPGPLDPVEWEVMQRHSSLGHDILAAAGLEEEARWVLHHHERPDGAGYPHGLAGDELPLESRIIRCADTFEAITSDRPYRAGRDAGVALAELRRDAGSQFDPDCVAALEAVLAARAPVAAAA